MAGINALATIGIFSMGEMGAGIAHLLQAHGHKVLTFATNRSSATQQRAHEAGAVCVSSYEDVLEQSDCILSIVPPANALVTAKIAIDAFNSVRSRRASKPLHYADLNAISPASTTKIARLFDSTSITYIDGGSDDEIVGPPPRRQPDGTWVKPSLVMSGPDRLRESLENGAELETTMNIKHMSPYIGSASGLKMCFASLTKGLTALAIQSFTTAHSLGVLPELQSHLESYSPRTGELAAKGILGMQSKAYRWVDEMKEIADTFDQDGGFRGHSDHRIFEGVSDIYRLIDQKTELGDKPADSVLGVVEHIDKALDEEKAKLRE